MDKNIKDTYWAFLSKNTSKPIKTHHGWMWDDSGHLLNAGRMIRSNIWWYKYLT
jgi:hypothetical protein